MQTLTTQLAEALELIKELEAKARELPNPYFEDQAAMVRQALQGVYRTLGVAEPE